MGDIAMWAETDKWSQPYFELRVVCYSCSEFQGTGPSEFDPAQSVSCFNCGARFSQEEGILRMLLFSVDECIERVGNGSETEAELLKIIDDEIFTRGRFGYNVSLNYTGYLRDQPHSVTFPMPFRHPPRVFLIVFPEGSVESSPTLALTIPSELDRVQITAYGRASSDGSIPFSLQVHGTAEGEAVALPPHFVFLDDAARAVARRDYALAVFLGATATEAFVDSLLMDGLKGVSDPDVVFELVSQARAEYKVRRVLPRVLGEKLPEELSQPYASEVSDPRNTFAHGRIPDVSLVQALKGLRTCLLCIVWALRRSDER